MVVRFFVLVVVALAVAGCAGAIVRVDTEAGGVMVLECGPGPAGSVIECKEI